MNSLQGLPMKFNFPMTPKSLLNSKFFTKLCKTGFGKCLEYRLSSWLLLPVKLGIHLILMSGGGNKDAYLRRSMPGLEPRDHKDKVRSPTVRHWPGQDMAREVTEHGELLPPSDCGHCSVQWGVTQLGQRDSQANDLAAWTEHVKDFTAASLWQLLAWKDSGFCAQLFLFLFF